MHILLVQHILCAVSAKLQQCAHTTARKIFAAINRRNDEGTPVVLQRKRRRYLAEQTGQKSVQRLLAARTHQDLMNAGLALTYLSKNSRLLRDYDT
jgi:hypothetical protein